MCSSLRWLLAAGLLTAGLALVATPASASKAAPPANSGILDRAKLFSEDALKKARERAEQIQKDYGKGLFIETVESAESKGAFEKMARARYKEHQVGGIYVLISKEPKARYVQIGDRTSQRAFTAANREKLLAVMRGPFNEGKYDDGLQQAITYVDETLNSTIGKGNRETAGTSAGGKTKAAGTGINPIWGWVCIGLVVILAIWLVVGLIRAFTRPSAPAGGPGYAGAPAGGGGGGGGFMSSMLGGLFGAAAGMYLYDSFFRSSPPVGGGMTPPAYGGDAAGPTDATSTGAGDWGGGDDAGAGGGDWGGADDGGSGGGDWGGGDAGGGDWGGGDAGGGDWGGGDGGGGDW